MARAFSLMKSTPSTTTDAPRPRHGDGAVGHEQRVADVDVRPGAARQHALQLGVHVEVRHDAHVLLVSSASSRRVVRVQRRQHEVTGQRGLDRDLDGLGVADLTDQDDVGVLAQDRAQRARERDAIASD
jgi:hypothetical protein